LLLPLGGRHSSLRAPQKEGRLSTENSEAGFAWARHVSINNAHYRTAKVEFRSTGKARWPFGWEILRQLNYPEGYLRGKRTSAAKKILAA